MKKLISILLVAALSLSLASCGTGGNSTTTVPAQTTSAPSGSDTSTDLGTVISAEVTKAFAAGGVTTETAYMENSKLVNIKVTYEEISSIALSVSSARTGIYNCLLALAPMEEDFAVIFSIYFPLTSGESTRVLYVKYEAEKRQGLTEKNFSDDKVFRNADNFMSNEAVRDFL